MYEDTYEVNTESTEPEYPCMYADLEDGDIGYDQGFRHSVEDLYGEIFWFTQEERSDAFILRENFNGLTRKEMNKLRKELGVKVAPYTYETFLDELCHENDEDINSA